METIAERKKIRVLIVDDSQAYRNLLSRELEKDPEVEVVSRAVNGRLALPRIKHYRPDFVVMDQEMPEMNGLETLEVVREKWPETAVIMFSSHTVEGARTTLRALQLGAVDFVAKPSAEEDIGAYLRRHLVSRIKAIAKERRAAHPELAASKLAPHPPDPGVSSALSDICAIGISTGGPAALRELLSKVPAAIRGSIVIVQHMPPIFTQQLAESLAQSSGLNVVEGAEGMTLTPGLVVIAPGGFHMEVVHDGQRARIRIINTEPELNCKPSVNVLFRSVAASFGERACALIMTGMGDDGYEGIKAIRAAGGTAYAQDKDSCVVYGMPSKPSREGLVQGIYDVHGLARVIYARLGVLHAG